MPRAVIYARFSSDRQNERSIDDQVAACRELCARQSLSITAVFDDRGISGATASNRPGFQAMLRAAEAKAFDVLVTEDLNRLTRGEGEAPQLRRKLEFLGIAIVTLSDGAVTKIHAGLKGLMDSMYLDTLAQHTRRGLEGVVRSGRSAGGRAYGYRAVPGQIGELAIVAHEAEIVREIFAAYAGGRSPRAIACDLNARNVPPPRGRHWNASTINGNTLRGNGLLANELYIGRIVWNKVRMVKDPDSGRRISRPNPKEQYRSAPAPQLRIVDDPAWAAVQAMKAKRHHAGGAHARAPRRLLSGLLRCGCCGGGMSSLGTSAKRIRVQCTRNRESGSCASRKMLYLDVIEQRAIEMLRDNLANPAAIALYVEKYNAERRRLARGAGARRAQLERRAGEIARELERGVQAILKGTTAADLMLPAMEILQAEATGIKTALAELGDRPEPIALHPSAVARYRRDVAELQDLLAHNAGPDDAAVMARVRDLIATVVVRPDGGVEIQGRLRELTDRAAWPGSMVAGARIIRSRQPEGPIFVLTRTA